MENYSPLAKLNAILAAIFLLLFSEASNDEIASAFLTVIVVI